MDCTDEYIQTLKIPNDLKAMPYCRPDQCVVLILNVLCQYFDSPQTMGRTNVPLDCRPCGHAMLEVWSGPQDANIHKYTVERKTVELGGELGIDAEIGWYTSKIAMDNASSLATHRGLKKEISQCSAKLDGYVLATTIVNRTDRRPRSLESDIISSVTSNDTIHPDPTSTPHQCSAK